MNTNKVVGGHIWRMGEGHVGRVDVSRAWVRVASAWVAASGRSRGRWTHPVHR